MVVEKLPNSTSDFLNPLFQMLVIEDNGQSKFNNPREAVVTNAKLDATFSLCSCASSSSVIEVGTRTVGLVLRVASSDEGFSMPILRFVSEFAYGIVPSDRGSSNEPRGG